MDKINALLADLENKIKENILEISNLRNMNDKLRAQNVILSRKYEKVYNLICYYNLNQFDSA